MSHWYDKHGRPHHGATDEVAAKAGYLPSVTTIISQLDCPPLSDWKVGKAISTASQMPKGRMERGNVYTRRVKRAMDRELSALGDIGTKTHNAIEQLLFSDGGEKASDPVIRKMSVRAYNGFLARGYRVVQVEQIIVGRGWAGTMDCAFETKEGIAGVLDWKVKETKLGFPPMRTESQLLQLVAYGQGYWKHCELFVNGIVSRNEDVVYFMEHGYAPYLLDTFNKLVDLWWLRNRHCLPNGKENYVQNR